MRKLLLYILVAISIESSGQNGSYGSVTAQFGFLKNSGRTTGGGLNLGKKINKNFGFGPGVEIMKFKDAGDYAPVYVDFRFFIPSATMQPFLMVQPGYGFYDSDPRLADTRGGFLFGAGIGLRGVKKLTPIVTVRYTHYQFRTSFTSRPQDNYKSTIDGVSINVGLGF